MPDAIFADPRLAALYDVLDGDRDDLDHYCAIVDELGAGSVVDIGCGTGTFACRLAGRGLEVGGIDPAAASLEIARTKPGADRVRWVHGDASAGVGLRADLVTMTGNVAQVFTTDEQWASVLAAARTILRTAGWLVFETRDPARAAWTRWNPTATRRVLLLPDRTRLTTWTEVLDVALPLVTFRHHFHFAPDDLVVSDSTLRFRTPDELHASLPAAGFVVREVRDAPDRPGLEFVVLAQAI